MSRRLTCLAFMVLVTGGLIAAPAAGGPEGAALAPGATPALSDATVTTPRADQLLGPRVEPAVLDQARARVQERRWAPPGASASSAPGSTHAWAGRRAVRSPEVRSPQAERYQAGLREARASADRRAGVTVQPGSFAAADRRVFLRNPTLTVPADLPPTSRP
jgi:hypothetical protein